MCVNRDPYARIELHKESIVGECDFCGSSNRSGKVWKYRTESDGGRQEEIKGQFCSKACMQDYYG